MSPIEFDQADLTHLFPPERTDAFFEALFGDPDEGAYDISLVFHGNTDHTLEFAYRLTARPGRCLACHLTSGLPAVFRRHPVIDLPGTITAIGNRLGPGLHMTDWQLGETRELGETAHEIPFRITFANNDAPAPGKK